MGRTIHIYGFPSYVTAELIKDFLEDYTGKGSVYALQVTIPKNKGPNPRAYADIQFTTTQNADYMSLLINQPQRLSYGTSYLKVFGRDRDIIPKPRVSMFHLKVPTLHFGCQVSNDCFYTLCKTKDVSVDFGFGFRKLCFLLSYKDPLKIKPVNYKLELSYESIWEIQLRRPKNLSSQFLIIQMNAAPRVYAEPLSSLGNAGRDLQYFMHTFDDQWVRTTDFTESFSIGQSSAMCLKIPYGCKLPNFRENFHYYTEDEGWFTMQPGSTVSRSLDLVPFVEPPDGHKLRYDILFKVNSLVQTGCLSGPTLDANFFRMVDPFSHSVNHIICALEKLFHLKDCCYEPVSWLSEQYLEYSLSANLPRSTSISLSDGLVYVRRVQVTPLKVYFLGPEINVSNRVLRYYREHIDNFIRISFVDEDSEKIRSTDLSARATMNDEKKQTLLYGRILSTLRNGVVIGDKKFEFLAFSASQLRDNSAWMFASKGLLTAASIRDWMGDFREIRNVAKYAARLGQSFGSSTETLSVSRDEIEKIDDVEIESNGNVYTFSDGIGKISSEFAHKVASKCGLKCTPSAFQIRYGGYKGVVAVDPRSVKKLYLRPSMRKFKSKVTKLDVLSWSKFQPCFLNRQVISLLSTLGVNDYVFEKKQQEAVDQLDSILTDPLKAYEALEIMSPAETTNILKEMLLCGYKPDQEPFLSMMLQTFRAAKLLELRTRTRIFVPKGRSMMGCLDETAALEYGQVFVQVSRLGRNKLCGDSSSMLNGNGPADTVLVLGKVVVAKNPCLHPGDMRVLQAVNVPALHHMVDCVVFPQKGQRPHPNECSGSDLDGDVYFVCWDQELIPLRQVEPMDYDASPAIELYHNVQIEEVEEYFANYMINDSLGVIANTHTAFADKEQLKAESKECIELAKLFSIAVDFPKTGVPAEIPPHLRVKEYPDFMEKLDRPTYESKRVMGKLFRQVKDIAPHTNHIKSFTLEVARKSYDADMEVDGFEDYLDDAWFHKGEFDYKLANLMDYYGIKTEAEILGGSVMKLSKSFNMRRDAESISLAVRALKKEARTWFDKKSIFNSGSQEDDDIYAKASAWYHVTYHPSYFGNYRQEKSREHFLSFPWCVYDKLIHIKKNNSMRRKHNWSLEDQFTSSLILS
ncbi:hypothetical protein C5167_043569 [Papaver somniferum]|uniref:RNA-dependent RNA polymerase n=1 Tax=Papaver somniferum TaxID=3469 RepID=A0A4Y7L7R7_PAPSO|nr:probable RNA-dependent RNA polymerase 1 [Papaver somniferum]XP_026422160.1 probable RNA-dependent RNA polymerase 1 [Papaver somniferum]RZC80987.1 hypothetical protein C5167_043569 [Papaver somniferum]